MRTPDVITLVGETPAAHGVFSAPAVSERKVYCSVRSVGMQEAYQAMANGLHPTYVFAISDFKDYEGEKILRFHGKNFRVIRTYRTGFGIELTCSEATIDAHTASIEPEVNNGGTNNSTSVS